MQIVIEIPDSEVPSKQELISVDLHFIDGHICECTYPFEELEAEPCEDAISRQEVLCVIQQLEKIADDFCNNYCHWPYVWDEADGDLSESEHCSNCPLNRI